MRTANTIVRNKTGLHARPASDFVVAAKEYTSKITIRDAAEDESTAVNAKSIVLLLAQGFEQGATVTLAADGPDEDLAVAGLIQLIESGFGEDE